MLHYPRNFYKRRNHGQVNFLQKRKKTLDKRKPIQTKAKFIAD